MKPAESKAKKHLDPEEDRQALLFKRKSFALKALAGFAAMGCAYALFYQGLLLPAKTAAALAQNKQGASSSPSSSSTSGPSAGAPPQTQTGGFAEFSKTQQTAPQPASSGAPNPARDRLLRIALPAEYLAFDISADAKRGLFVSGRGADMVDLRTLKTSPAISFSGAASPAGAALAASGAWAAYILRDAQGDTVAVLDIQSQKQTAAARIQGGQASEPFFSDDGRRLYWFARQNGEAGWDLYCAEGPSVRRLTAFQYASAEKGFETHDGYVFYSAALNAPAPDHPSKRRILRLRLNDLYADLAPADPRLGEFSRPAPFGPGGALCFNASLQGAPASVFCQSAPGSQAQPAAANPSNLPFALRKQTVWLPEAGPSGAFAALLAAPGPAGAQAR